MPDGVDTVRYGKDILSLFQAADYTTDIALLDVVGAADRHDPADQVGAGFQSRCNKYGRMSLPLTEILPHCPSQLTPSMRIHFTVKGKPKNTVKTR